MVTINGTNNNDILIANILTDPEVDTITGLKGNDFLSGLGGDDFLYGDFNLETSTTIQITGDKNKVFFTFSHDHIESGKNGPALDFGHENAVTATTSITGSKNSVYYKYATDFLTAGDNGAALYGDGRFTDITILNASPTNQSAYNKITHHFAKDTLLGSTGNDFQGTKIRCAITMGMIN